MNKAILLNKTFTGGWLDKNNNLAHEIIDFVLDDNRDHYIYNVPYGGIPSDIYVKGQEDNNKRKYEVKYLLIISNYRYSKNYETYTVRIDYICELERTLHSYTNSLKGNKEIEGLKNITYGKKNIEKIWDSSDNPVSLVTFKCNNMYKVFKEFKFKNYNPQRNRGIMYSDNNKYINDFNNLSNFIKNNLNNKFELKKLDNNTSYSSFKPTLLDLIGVDRQEEVYTNIIYCLLSDNKDIVKSLFNEYIDSDFKIYKEYAITNGRLDLLIKTDKNIIIIENKIDSGINGKDRNDSDKNQINTYFEYYSIENNNIKERDKKDQGKGVILYILAPDYNLEDIKNEVGKFDNLKDKVENNKIQFMGYSSFSKIDSSNIKGRLNKYKELIHQAFVNLSYNDIKQLYMEMFIEQIKKIN